MTGRKAEGCDTCGSKPYDWRDWRRGVNGNCRVCGASPSKWRDRSHILQRKHTQAEADRVRLLINTTPVPALIADAPAENTGVWRKASSRLAKEQAWQDSHERRMTAKRRLGLDVRAPAPVHGGTISAEDQWTKVLQADADPRAELLAAARSGDEDAMATADCLYENWQRETRRAV